MSMGLDRCPRATDQDRDSSSSQLPISLTGNSFQPAYPATSSSLPQPPSPAPLPRQYLRSGRPHLLNDYEAPRAPAYPDDDHAARYHTPITGNDIEYQTSRHLQSSLPSSTSFPTTLPPPPALALPSITSPAQMLSLAPQLSLFPLPPPAGLHNPSSSQAFRSRPPTSNSNAGASPIGVEGAHTPLAISRRNSSNDPLPRGPETSHSHKNSQSSVQLGSGFMKSGKGTKTSAGTKVKSVSVKQERPLGQSQKQTSLNTRSALLNPSPVTAVTTVAAAAPAPPKSRRVRTGCLTCRERHLKCDEGTPDCLNCRKGNRECKRGLRLNFIDIQTKPIPFVPPTNEWSVSFLDESRLIASEYAGGLGRYPRTKDIISLPSRVSVEETSDTKRRRSSATVVQPVDAPYGQASTSIVPASMSVNSNLAVSTQLQQNPDHRHGYLTSGAFVNTNNNATYSPYALKEEQGEKRHPYQESDASSVASSMIPQGVGGPSSVASFQAEVGNSPEEGSPRVAARPGVGIGNVGHLNDNMPEGLPTPPSEKMGLLRGSIGGGSHVGRALEPGGGSATGGFDDIYNMGSTGNNGEREYLNSSDEVLFMQVFVDEVGVWMDSLDRDKHFSRIIPFVALKSPMMLNAFLACGVKHLTLVNEAYKDDKALFYYDTATTQLLRSLQNPDRDIVECATTAVVLNVYEIMSEKPNERMNHIAGARALIRECGWDARSKGIGAACFWLNIGMEVLSCLAFNFPTAWKPDDWGLDTSFADSSHDNKSSEGSGTRGHRDGKETMQTILVRQDNIVKTESATVPMSLSTTLDGGDEEVWVHRIFYIVAKIANFRANAAPLHEPSPHDEQFRLQDRFEEWKQLKRLCAIWNRDCPRSMRPFSYLFPTQDPSSGSIFPNIWLIKRAAVIGRLFYHTAMVLLHQVNPDEPHNSTGNQNAQRHHSHQVCGIVAHTKDRGVASVAIRSLAIAAYVLRDPREQEEVISLLRKITAETGWRIGRIYAELEQIWGREIKDTAGNSLSGAASTSVSTSPSTLPPPPIDLPPPTSMLTHGYGQAGGQGSTVTGGSGPGFTTLAGSFLHRTLGHSASSMPFSSSNSRRSIPSVPSGNVSLHHHPPHQLQTVASAFSSTGASAPVGATAPSSIHSSPSIGSQMPYRQPQMVNPLVHADFSLPDHPYKAFYKPPNDSAHSN